jgi:hypothetical protein
MQRAQRNTKKTFDFADYADFHSGDYEISSERLGSDVLTGYVPKRRKSRDSDSDFDMSSATIYLSDSDVEVPQTDVSDNDPVITLFEQCSNISIDPSSLNENHSDKVSIKTVANNLNQQDVDESIVSDIIAPPNLLNLADFILNEYTKANEEIHKSKKISAATTKKERKKKVTTKKGKKAISSKNRNITKNIPTKKKKKKTIKTKKMKFIKKKK